MHNYVLFMELSMFKKLVFSGDDKFDEIEWTIPIIVVGPYEAPNWKRLGNKQTG